MIGCPWLRRRPCSEHPRRPIHYPPSRCPFGRIAIYGYLTISNEIQNHWLIRTPLSPRKQRVSRIGPQQSRARSGEANLDGEDRSDTMKREGKGGAVLSLPAGINEDDSDQSCGRKEVCHSAPLFGTACPPAFGGGRYRPSPTCGPGTREGL